MGLPKIVQLTSTEVTEALRPVLNQILGTIKAVLEETPPELSSDIIDKGIVLSGGTSLLRGFDKLVTEQLGVSAHVSEDPMRCVVKGIGMALENIELYKRTLVKK